MTVNLRQMAQDEVCFRFESDEDKREFWELYIENNGSKCSNRSLLDILMQDNSTNFKVFVYYNEIFYGYSNNSWKYPTWTEIKEKYKMRDNIVVKLNIGTKGIKQAVDNCIETIKKQQTHRAITLLQSLGYKVEAPYIPPTDEEICERLRFENSKISYVPDWNSTNEKYQVTFDTDRNTYRLESRIYTKNVGVVYTTKEIATQIVAELNEKRFERRDE